MMRTGSIYWGLSSLLHRKIMSLMHRSVCWTSSAVSGCCEHLTYMFWWLSDSSVRNVKRFRFKAPKAFFWNVGEHMRCSKSWNWDFRLVPTSRGMRPLTSFLSLQTKGEKLNRWACAQIVWVLQSLESSGSYLPDEIVMVLQSHCHQATRASWWTITYQG